MKNRLKKRESTHCTFTECGNEIKEGDILTGGGDNYPCVILYDKFETKFCAVEFGYMTDENYLYRNHDMLCSTQPWKIIGNVDDNFDLLIEAPEDFDYTESVKEYYDDHYKKPIKFERLYIGMSVVDYDGDEGRIINIHNINNVEVIFEDGYRSIVCFDENSSKYMPLYWKEDKFK